MPFVNMLVEDASKDGVVVGARVRIDGLKAKPEFNGVLATVRSYNEEKGRFDVQPDDTADFLALKPDNLAVVEAFADFPIGTRVRIAGTSVERLNGKVATVEGFMGERCNVKLDDETNLVALKPAVLAVAEER